jgi:hypothetical protein
LVPDGVATWVPQGLVMEGGMAATRLRCSDGRDSGNEHCKLGKADNGHDEIDFVVVKGLEMVNDLKERERDLWK